MEVRYPEVTVRLVGEDGNAFAIIGRVSRELKRQIPGDAGRRAAAEFGARAMESGSYDALLRLCMSWVNVE